MSSLNSHISHFKFDTSFISCCFIIDFQAKTDTIAQWIRPPHSMIQTPLLPHQKTRLAFLWDQQIPNGQSACNLWATSPPGSTSFARHIITNKVVISFESLSTNTPLGGLLVDDMGLGKPIQAISLIGTSKEQLIANPHFSMPTMIICPPCLNGPTCHSLSKA
ncbi:hypothetical protein O181_047989 [Austropuccinia psidii MF-1]|uniref:SNF2 N-terminal domain-containing protein n=1 Tax=Austropuccinia psidii MF-1 TaxID=1389203 RepID=A0A9Q3DS41_9BASI|nr:hypothetical protein [Austropuccinia psidii MF-1]